MLCGGDNNLFGISSPRIDDILAVELQELSRIEPTAKLVRNVVTTDRHVESRRRELVQRYKWKPEYQDRCEFDVPAGRTELPCIGADEGNRHVNNEREQGPVEVAPREEGGFVLTHDGHFDSVNLREEYAEDRKQAAATGPHARH